MFLEQNLDRLGSFEAGLASREREADLETALAIRSQIDYIDIFKRIVEASLEMGTTLEEFGLADFRRLASLIDPDFGNHKEMKLAAAEDGCEDFADNWLSEHPDSFTARIVRRDRFNAPLMIHVAFIGDLIDGQLSSPESSNPAIDNSDLISNFHQSLSRMHLDVTEYFTGSRVMAHWLVPYLTEYPFLANDMKVLDVLKRIIFSPKGINEEDHRPILKVVDESFRDLRAENYERAVDSILADTLTKRLQSGLV